MTGGAPLLDKRPMSLGVPAEAMLLAAAAGAAESPLEAETGLRETAACTAAAAWEAGEAVTTASSVKVSALTAVAAAVHSLCLVQSVIITPLAVDCGLQHDACVARMLPYSLPALLPRSVLRIQRYTFVIEVCSSSCARAE
jgi:hypothetical protein